MDKPIRVQRKRIKGWKMPENTVYVGRPTRWGNYYFRDKISSLDDLVWIDDYGDVTVRRAFQIMTDDLLTLENIDDWIKPLIGKNLACWCSLDKPCHADVLLKLANS